MFDWLTWEHHPDVGFRFSTADGLVIAAVIPLTVYLWQLMGGYGLVPAYLFGHFLLFCNIIRIRRSFELIWSGLFITNVVAWLQFAPSPTGPMLSQLPVTALLVAFEIRSDRYHGIWARERS